MEKQIRKGDDSDAFDFGFIEIYLENAEQYTISKAVVKFGTVVKVYENPIYPLRPVLNHEETAILNECKNEIAMTVYDAQGRRFTPEQVYEFGTKPQLTPDIQPSEENNG